MVTTVLMIIGGFALIIILILLGYQWTNAHRVTFEFGPRSVKFEIVRSDDPKRTPSRRNKKLPAQRGKGAK